jgi:murein DD-endopeptidase MepM/ murein hydrolase activator NlpD
LIYKFRISLVRACRKRQYPLTVNFGKIYFFNITCLYFITILLINSCNSNNVNIPACYPNSPDTLNRISKKNPNYICGIAADSFNVSYGRVNPNSFLSDMLSSYGITLQVIDKLLKNSSGVFDIREIRAEHRYTVLADKDSLKKARFFIYEHEPSLFYIFSFKDSLNITPYRLKTDYEIKFVSGTIQTSLWDSMIEAGLNPELCISMSEIYAWTIDFFGLQKGDSYRIIFKENFIGNTSLGISKIYGIEFLHSGKEIYAIPLIQNGTESYYDTSGYSLRRAFLKAPLKYARVSSGFSSGRMHPILRIVRPHFGVDYSAPVGTAVQSIGDGKVISAGVENESGRIVRIMHNSVYSTAYLHLSSFGKGIFPGAKVKQGDIIGFVGSSGLSTGPHLDFRFYKNGFAVDPLKIEAPPVEPVLPENREKFDKTRRVVLDLLRSIK